MYSSSEEFVDSRSPSLQRRESDSDSDYTPKQKKKGNKEKKKPMNQKEQARRTSISSMHAHDQGPEPSTTEGSRRQRTPSGSVRSEVRYFST